MKLKYGCNPDQIARFVQRTINPPFTFLNGNPGYINLLDAVYSYSLVSEAKKIFSRPCAASFKHTSPAGVALGTTAKDAYERARNCDPKSSFGDFIAINCLVDEELAKYIKVQVSDGIVAPDFTQEALDILKKKKQNNFLVIKGDQDAILDYGEETKQFGNITLSQSPSATPITEQLLTNVVSKTKQLSQDIKEDMLLSMVTLKYTQSNSTCFVYQGQAIGIGAGQQSRIDCVRLARYKSELWFLRQLVDLPFKAGLKRQDRINATISYLQDDFSPIEYRYWQDLFTEIPRPLTASERNRLLGQFDNIVLGSDGFFPFRDSIDQASKINVRHVVQPGGSRADQSVIEAVDEYDMTMVFTGLRLFLH
jgi:phosphoribosylaminoimidazolecarboxamide formyltransferase/IMP cyclohydrolase